MWSWSCLPSVFPYHVIMKCFTFSIPLPCDHKCFTFSVPLPCDHKCFTFSVPLPYDHKSFTFSVHLPCDQKSFTFSVHLPCDHKSFTFSVHLPCDHKSFTFSVHLPCDHKCFTFSVHLPCDHKCFTFSVPSPCDHKVFTQHVTISVLPSVFPYHVIMKCFIFSIVLYLPYNHVEHCVVHPSNPLWLLVQISAQIHASFSYGTLTMNVSVINLLFTNYEISWLFTFRSWTYMLDNWPTYLYIKANMITPNMSRAARTTGITTLMMEASLSEIGNENELQYTVTSTKWTHVRPYQGVHSSPSMR